MVKAGRAEIMHWYHNIYALQVVPQVGAKQTRWLQFLLQFVVVENVWRLWAYETMLIAVVNDILSWNCFYKKNTRICFFPPASRSWFLSPTTHDPNSTLRSWFLLYVYCAVRYRYKAHNTYVQTVRIGSTWWGGRGSVIERSFRTIAWRRTRAWNQWRCTQGDEHSVGDIWDGSQVFSVAHAGTRENSVERGPTGLLQCKVRRFVEMEAALTPEDEASFSFWY